jgi:hypothetical protein
MMREKLDESKEWSAVTSEEQRQACSAAVAAAINWFDEEVGIDTNTSQVLALLLMFERVVEWLPRLLSESLDSLSSS